MLKYSPSLPMGYLTDESGQIVKAKDDAEYQAAANATASSAQSNDIQANAIIDADPNITPEQKQMMKDLVSVYAGGSNVDNKAILEAFDKIKANTIDPHYADLINQTQSVLKSNLQALAEQRALQLEQQGVNATEATRQAQQSLEASGLLDTGEAVRQLGAEAPQVPFGGQPMEGLVQKQNRFIATDTQQRYQQTLREQLSGAEQALGTAGLSGIQGLPQYKPIGGVTGSLETAKQKEMASTLSALAENQKSKNVLNTNLQNNKIF
jgi:hypothetical protein